MNTLKHLRTRLGDRTHSAALDLNDDDRHLATVCTLHHRVPAGTWAALAGAAVTALASNRRAAFGPLAVLAAAAGVVQVVLDRTHSIAVAYPGHPCQDCPQPDDGKDDGRGDGGVWLDGDWDNIPPAPGPMAELDDDRIRAMAGDLDEQMHALVELQGGERS